MNNLIRTFTTTLLLCIATMTFAQSQNYVRSISNAKYLTEKLDLTNEQTKRIQAMLEEQDKQLKDLRSSGITDKDRARKASNEIRTNTNNAIKSTLTAEQLPIFNELLLQRNKLRSKTGKRASAFSGSGDLIKDLSLTESQITAYKLIRAQQSMELKAIRESMGNADERAAAMIKMNEIKKASEEKIKKILTEEQLALFNNILSKRRSRN